jgi:hypothetical protein
VLSGRVVAEQKPFFITLGGPKVMTPPVGMTSSIMPARASSCRIICRCC